MRRPTIAVEMLGSLDDLPDAPRTEARGSARRASSFWAECSNKLRRDRPEGMRMGTSRDLRAGGPGTWIRPDAEMLWPRPGIRRSRRDIGKPAQAAISHAAA